MKFRLCAGVLAALFMGSLGLTVATADQGGVPSGDDAARVKAGLAYAQAQGITLDLKGRNVGRVGLGSYLVNAVGGCNDCHTAPPFTADPYAYLGAPKQVNVACYLAGGTEFGPFVSRDITPFENGMPAGLTLDGFVHVLRTGEDPDNQGQVLHVMPWPVYQTMTDSDLRAIYEYLSAIPAIEKDTCGAPSV